jgi:thymidylate synthase (FAD)
MRIVEPSVELVSTTIDPERVIERMCRICYQSDHKVKKCEMCNGTGGCVFNHGTAFGGLPEICAECHGTGTDIASAIDFINKIKANGHESVLEHAYASFSIITDRGVTHEIVRHRIGMSYSQESTRYCNYSKDTFGQEITVMQPPGLGISKTLCTVTEWCDAMACAERVYLKMLSGGIAPQIARSVLPNSLKSEIGVTGNFRSWRHFLHLRTSTKAHPQMRQIAEMIREHLLTLSPVCFDDIP